MGDYVALFTGQGSQFVGMGSELYEASPAAREVMDEAEAALPGLKALCFEGPAEELTLTVNQQPTVLAVDVAVFRASGAAAPQAGAGHSLGEYAALVVAGSLDFATAVLLVRARAQSMQEAVPAGTGGMVVLLKGDLEEAKAAAAEATAGICDLANVNCPGQYVLSGETSAMQEILDRFGRRARLLPVSVPFHSTMLTDAGAEFAKVLDDTPFEDPAFPIVCNVDAIAVTTGAAARDALKRQFAGSVLWQQSIEHLLEQGYRRFREFGPKSTLERMVKAIAKERGDEVETT
ncbi:MAG: malonyl CoA-acyl carrier protein transacylase [Planctomycetes bacterium]|nr:malonyl CoA-acyl carrier protein transacylase [Planctomycetota bacterium]